MVAHLEGVGIDVHGDGDFMQGRDVWIRFSHLAGWQSRAWPGCGANCGREYRVAAGRQACKCYSV